MKVIVVDDEQWSINQFKYETKDMEDITIIGDFNNPFDAISFAKETYIEVAFLDIEMPGMNGIELAKKLREIYPKIVIIFISAYSNYLMDFIKLHADYYLLKPYTKADIVDVIDRTKLLIKRQEKRVRIVTFGSFDVFIDGKPVNFNGKKVKELFAILVDKRGNSVNSEEAFSRLWEDEEYNNESSSKLRKLWSRLQEFLYENNLLELVNFNKTDKSLNCDMVDCDYFDFLDGERFALRNFTYMYMTEYWWGEETLANLTAIKYEYNKENGLDI